MSSNSSAIPAKAPGYENHLKSHDDFQGLKAKCGLRRLALIESELDITHTIATFSDPRKDNHKFLEARRRAAHKGYELITKLLSDRGPSDEMEQVLDIKLNQLCAELLRLDDGLPCDATNPWPGIQSAPIVNSPPHSPARNNTPETLTTREMEVLRHIALGLSSKQTAALLGITFKTAACHRYRLMDKLGIHDTATLARYAVRNGIVQA